MAKKSYTLVEKAAICAEAREILAAGGNLHQASKRLSVSQSALTKWLNPPASKPAKKLGRPRILQLSDEERAEFQRQCLACGSGPEAARRLMEWEDVRAETRRALGELFERGTGGRHRVSLPVSLREAMQIPESVQAMFRGPKHAREFEPKARRDGTVEIEGVRVPWVPGCIFESDDMSLNEPYRVMNPELRREMVNRQGLFTKDSATSAWLQFDLCARAFDAYRAEDVMDHLLAVVDEHGLPVGWRLEQGVWKSNAVKGIPIKGREERWGALSDLFVVWTKHHSTGKPNVERGFHEVQKLSAHASTCIGRERGEFEVAKKLMDKANRGNIKALDYFWAISTCADKVAEILHEENSRQREFEKTGEWATPLNLWKARAHRRDLAKADRWYFCPVKRRARIRKGVIEIKVDHYRRKFRFQTTGAKDFPILRENYPVLIAFHPGRPEEGCHVFSAAEGAMAAGRRWGSRLGTADWFRDVPEEVIGGEGDFSQVKKGSAAIRAEFRTIIEKGTGPGTKKSVARDGLGNALVIQKGGSPGDDVVLPPKPKRIPERSATLSRPMPDTAAGVVEEMDRLRAALDEVP